MAFATMWNNVPHGVEQCARGVEQPASWCGTVCLMVWNSVPHGVDQPAS